MQNFLEFFIRRPLLVNVISVMFFLTGAIAISSLPFNAFPEVDTGLISVVTRNPGSSAEDIELSITVPLEQEFLQIDGVDKVKSNSIEGQSTIMVMGDPSAPMKSYDDLEVEVYNAIDRAMDKLPGELHSKPIVTRPENFQNAPLIQVLITGTVPEETLRNMARRLRLELRNLRGVSGVEYEGYRQREVRILLDDAKLQRLGISPDQVAQAINSRKVRDTGGSLISAAIEQDILTIGKFEHPKDVEDVVVYEGQSGDFVRVKDIAKVHFDFADPVVRSLVGNRVAISLLVKGSETVDRLGTAVRVKDFIKEKNAHMPADVDLFIVNDESLSTLAILEVLIGNGIAGIILVVLVLALFFKFRLTIWVAMGVPMAIMMTFMVMPWIGLSVNMMSMAALVLMLGILVDDGVIVAESIFRHHEYGYDPIEAAAIGTYKVVSPVVSSALTTIAALLPAAFLGGLQGKVFYIIPAMAMVVLLMSLLECQIILPCHIAESLKTAGTGRLSRPWFERIEDAYETLMMKVVPRRYLFTFSFIALFVIAAVLATRHLVFVASPDVNADVFFVKAKAPVGTPFEVMEQKLLGLEQELRDLIPAEDLKAIVVTTGHQDHNRQMVTEGRDPAWGLISVYMNPITDRKTNTLELRDQLMKRYENREGFDLLTVRIANLSIDLGMPLEAVIFGNSSNRDEATELLTNYVRSLEGVTEVWSDYTPGKPIIRLKLDYNQLARYGLTVKDISSAIKLAFNGQIVDSFETVDDTILYRMQLDGVDLRDPASLYSLSVTNHAGKNILLRNLVEFEQGPGEGNIHHFLGDRATTVYADIDRSVISVEQINKKVSDFIRDEDLLGRFPGLSFYQGGEIVVVNEQTGEVGKAALLAAVAIFAILLLLFHSYVQPLMALFLIPFGVVGVMVAFELQGMVFSFGAMIGILGLMGVIVNDAVVMLHRLNVERSHLSEHEETLLHDRQIVECASVRLRPVVITTITTCAGLFPAAYEIIGSNDTLTPLIMAMFWGMLISSIATLFLVPCLYAIERDVEAKLNPHRARQTLEDVIMYN